MRKKYLDNIQFKVSEINDAKPCSADAFFGRVKKFRKKSTLFHKGKISQAFFTEDSRLYISPTEQELLKSGCKLNREVRKWDALCSRIVHEYKQQKKVESDVVLKKLEEQFARLNSELSQTSQSFISQFSMARLWNMSIVGAILVGMFSMSMIYRYLGQGASAGAAENINTATGKELISSQQELVKIVNNEDFEIAELADENMEQADFEKKAVKMVKGYPIEKMLPYILEKDRKTAAFLIAIARKESSWGQRVPLLEGQDCYNYWGYRGQRKLMGTGGHTCFNSRKDAVDTVAKRVDTLINDKNLDTAAEMVIWKCGNSCAATGGQAAANKWISDVDGILSKLNK